MIEQPDNEKPGWCEECRSLGCPAANQHPGKKLMLVEPRVMAQRLGIARERLSLEIVKQVDDADRRLYFEIFVDGEHLTPAQEKIAGQYISECIGSSVVFPKVGNS